MNYKSAVAVAAVILLALPLSVVITFILRMAGEEQGMCGNGLLEQGESTQNCCEDTGCLPSQSCTNSSCINITCGYCEYAANETCHRYECCSDSECGKDETCSSNINKCAQIECECGYIKNRACTEYECCNNLECPSGLCSNNKCVVEAQKKATVSEEEGSKVRRSSGSGSSSQEQQGSQQQAQQQQGQQTCTPNPEVCDGVDNDCNRLIDDGITCECSAGQTRSCGTSSIGTCKLGTQTCQSSHIWGSCTGQTEPSTEACDSKDNDCDGQTDEGELCSSGQLCVSGSCKAVDANYKVQPVILYPTDYANDQEMTNYLKGKFEEIRQFYLTKAGTTFTMLQPQVVSGDHSHEWYWCVDSQAGCVQNNFEANIAGELIAKGYMAGTWEKSAPDRIIWAVVFGGGGYAGGRTYPQTGGGFAILGDAGIYAAKDNSCSRILSYYYYPQELNNIKQVCQNSWLTSGKAYGFGIGALGHELGHAFNLPHPDGYAGTTTADWEKTLMGNHWNYPNTGLLEQDKEKLLESPFFNTKS